MSFRVLINGEEVKTFDEQVTRVTLMTGRGAAGSVGISTEGAVDLQVEYARAGGPMRLDHLEALQRRELQERGKDESAGSPPQEVSKELTGVQGDHTYTAEPGGVSEQTGSNPTPSRDLAEGLEADDEATRTARIQAFSNDGDADAAIENNPAGSESTPAEEAPAPNEEEDTFA